MANPEAIVRALLYLADLLRSGKVQCRLLARRQVTEVIGTSEKSVRRGHQRVAMKTLRTYFSELVYGELQSPIGSRLLHRRTCVPRERSGNAEQFGTIFSCSLLGASPMEAQEIDYSLQSNSCQTLGCRPNDLAELVQWDERFAFCLVWD